MLVNFTLICLSVITIHKVNPLLASAITVFKSRPLQIVLSVAGILLLLNFLHIHIIKDLHSGQPAWYFHITFIWLIVMGIAGIIYFRELKKLKKSGIDTNKHFSTLPPE